MRSRTIALMPNTENLVGKALLQSVGIHAARNTYQEIHDNFISSAHEEVMDVAEVSIAVAAGVGQWLLPAPFQEVEQNNTNKREYLVDNQPVKALCIVIVGFAGGLMFDGAIVAGLVIAAVKAAEETHNPLVGFGAFIATKTALGFVENFGTNVIHRIADNRFDRTFHIT